MITYYYLEPMPEFVRERRLRILEEIYGNKIKIVEYDPFNRAEFYKNNIVIINDIFDIVPNNDANIANELALIAAYKRLIDNNVIVRFEKSPQCNSEYINQQMKDTGLTGWDNFESLLKLAIQNYREFMKIDYAYRRQHVVTAAKNGHPLGNKKGVKLTTKKSVEMKEKIKEMCKEFDGDMQDIDVRTKLGISKNTYFKYKKEIKEEYKK